MNDKEKELKERTKKFALRTIKMVESLPKSTVGYEFGKQVFRSATSVSANYRAACRAKSKRDFIYKLEIVLEEADESLLWFELIAESGTIKTELLEGLMDEANQLVSIFTKSIKTLKENEEQKVNLTSKI